MRWADADERGRRFIEELTRVICECMSGSGQLSWDFRFLRCVPPLLRDLGLTHTVTHTRKKADGVNGWESVKDQNPLQQKCPERAGQRYSQGFQSLGKDGETGPCRNNTVKNGEESSAKPGFFLQISTFPAVFNLAFLA